MTSTISTIDRRDGVGIAGLALLGVLVVPAVGWVLLIGSFLLGMPGILILIWPALSVGVILFYRRTTRSMRSGQTRAAARELGAAVLAVDLGLEIWAAALAVGLAFDIVPFLGDGAYPYADVWGITSVVLAVAVVPLAWWLLRRFAGDRSSH